MSRSEWIYNCDCVKPLVDKAVELLVDHPEKITEVYLEPVTLSGGTASWLEVKIDGAKRKKRFPVVHTYCPFCGKKFGDE